jgi:hypothetical protein
VLSALSVVATWLELGHPGIWTALVAHFSIVILVGFFSLTILNYVVQSGRVTLDKILAAVCVYFMVGYAWTFAYAILDDITPDAFAGLVPVAEDQHAFRIMQLRDFSFVTLTTMGYGDITPRSPSARTMAMLEAVMGQFYLAVLVARLVGLHIVHEESGRRRRD